MYCEVLNHCVILIVDGEEVVGCVDCVGECSGLVKGVLESLVGDGAR